MPNETGCCCGDPAPCCDDPSIDTLTWDDNVPWWYDTDGPVPVICRNCGCVCVCDE